MFCLLFPAVAFVLSSASAENIAVAGQTKQSNQKAAGRIRHVMRSFSAPKRLRISRRTSEVATSDCELPWPATGVSQALRALSVLGVSPWGVFGALQSLGSGVSEKCPESVWNTFLALREHSRDTFWTRGARRAPKTPRRDTSIRRRP